MGVRQVSSKVYGESVAKANKMVSPHLQFEKREHRCGRIHQVCQVVCLFVSVWVLTCSSCAKRQPQYKYRLSRGGYSASTGILLVAEHIDTEQGLKGVSLIVYNEKEAVASYLFPIEPEPLDFAWNPKQDAFMVTHGDRLSVFREGEQPGSYQGTATRCPLDIFYTYCAWNPSGDWLAVNCWDLRKASKSHRLGLYSNAQERLVVTNIAINYDAPIWKDEASLLVPQNDGVVEVRIGSGMPQIVRRIPLQEGTTLFYGIFNGQPLVQKDKKIKLGSKTLTELDRHSRTAVIATPRWLFVAASAKALIAFDHSGGTLSKIEPGGLIKFGSVGADPDTVYGLTANAVVRVFIEGGSLKVTEVCDLDRLRRAGLVAPGIQTGARALGEVLSLWN